MNEHAVIGDKGMIGTDKVSGHICAKCHENNDISIQYDVTGGLFMKSRE